MDSNSTQKSSSAPVRRYFSMGCLSSTKLLFQIRDGFERNRLLAIEDAAEDAICLRSENFFRGAILNSPSLSFHFPKPRGFGLGGFDHILNPAFSILHFPAEGSCGYLL